MFRYFGRKYSYIDEYPPPKYKTIIEPFAGSASYSLYYHDRNVILCEKDPILYDIWKYLIKKATPKRILSFPIFENNEYLSDYTWLKPVERDLLGFFINASNIRPALKPNPLKTYNQWNEKTRKQLSEDIKKIKHWKIIFGDYTQIKNVKATWFIDPPYSGRGGGLYKHSNKNIDFKELANWVKSRKGEVIVCENEENTKWLSFKKFKKRTQNGIEHYEMLYHNIN